MILEFEDIPVKDEISYAMGVEDCLEKLGYTYAYVEHGPITKDNDGDEVTVYKVVGVEKDPLPME